MTRIVYYNLTRETTSGTPGVSTTVTVNGAVSGHRTFSSHSDLAVGDTFYYLMEDLDDLDWEIGLGTWTGSNQFTRQSTCLDNSSGDTSLINFGSNTEVALIWTSEAILDFRIGQKDIAVFSSTTLSDSEIIELKNDSDGGSWKSKVDGTSMGRPKEIMLVSAEGSSDNLIKLWDLTTALPTLLQSWTVVGATHVSYSEGGIYIFTAAEIILLDWVLDTVFKWDTGGLSIGDQNVSSFDESTVTWVVIDSSAALSDAAVNSGVAFYKSTAGQNSVRKNLKYPTLLVGTDSGADVVNHDGSSGNEGTVINLSDTTGDDIGAVTVNADYDIAVVNVTQAAVNVWRNGSYTTTSTTPDASYTTTSIPALLDTPDATTSLGSCLSDVLAVGGSSGVVYIKEDTSTQSSGEVTYITDSYNSSGMYGDIRGAWMADTETGDIGAELVTNGTFDTSTTGWTGINGGVLSVDTQRLKVTNGVAAFGRGYQAISTVAGLTYTVCVDFTLGTSVAGCTVQIRNDNINGTILTTSGVVTSSQTIVLTFTAVSSISIVWLGNISSTISEYSLYDNVTVTEVIEDHSVKGNDLTIVNGPLTRTAVASGADLVGYSAFTSTKYGQYAYTSDLDYGTGDFYFKFFMKSSGNSGVETLISRADTGLTNGAIDIELQADGTIRCRITDDGFSTADSVTSTNTLDDNNWHCVEFLNDSGTLRLRIDGREDTTATVTNAASGVSNGSAILVVGARADASNGATTTTLAWVRTGAYAPSATQSLRAYTLERLAFEVSAECTLQGTSNSVQAVACSGDTDKLFVATADGSTLFNGVVVDSYIDDSLGYVTNDNHTSIALSGEYYSIGNGAELLLHTPEKSTIEDT